MRKKTADLSVRASLDKSFGPYTVCTYTSPACRNQGVVHNVYQGGSFSQNKPPTVAGTGRLCCRLGSAGRRALHMPHPRARKRCTLLIDVRCAFTAANSRRVVWSLHWRCSSCSVQWVPRSATQGVIRGPNGAGVIAEKKESKGALSCQHVS